MSDWRALLGKYLAHVADEEGIDFLDAPTPPSVRPGSKFGPTPDLAFSQEEWDALRGLSDEVLGPRSVPSWRRDERVGSGNPIASDETEKAEHPDEEPSS